MSDTYRQAFYDVSARLAEKWVNILDARPDEHSVTYLVEFRVTLSTGVSRWVKTVYTYPQPANLIAKSPDMVAEWLEAQVDKTREALLAGRARFSQLPGKDRGE